MQKKRTWMAMMCAFSLTLCLLLFAVGLLVVSMRSGRTLFGETYEPVTLQQELPIGDEQEDTFIWLPARLRVLLRLPMWETQFLEWLSKNVKRQVVDLPLYIV